MSATEEFDPEGPESSISGIVLAGGGARRMRGVNKALLRLGTISIIERVANLLRSLFSEVIIVTNTPDEFAFLGLPMVGDVRRGYGSLGGLYTGLAHCSGEYGFLVACDMPFLRSDIIQMVTSRLDGPDVVIPRVSKGLEPLHAAYSRTCLGPMERLMDSGDLKIINFFHEVEVLEVPESELAALDPDFNFLFNVNSPADLARARQIHSTLLHR